MKYGEILEFARYLRQNQTPAEKKLWNILRNRKTNGIKFLRQWPIIYECSNKEYFFYIPDFYCSKHKVAIELDGKIHEYQMERDKNRDKILNEKGIKVLRIKNEELENVNNVKGKIIGICKSDSPPSPLY